MNRSDPGAAASSRHPPDAVSSEGVDGEASIETQAESWHSARRAPRPSNGSGPKSLPPRPGVVPREQPVTSTVSSGSANRPDSRTIEIEVTRGRPAAAAIEAFESGIRTVRALNHSGVLPVTELTRSARKITVQMHAAPEVSLESQLTDRLQPWSQVCELLQPVVDTLASLHAAGVAHGGLRPRRILIGPSGPLLADIGLAMLEGTPLSGTPETDEACLSPEQWSGHSYPVTPAMDVYSLGVILYRLLCGRYPYRTKSRMELLRQVLEDPPQPPRQLTRSIPRPLENLCLECLACHPDARPPHATEVASRLRQVVQEHDEQDSYDSTASLPAQQSARRPLGPERLLQIEIEPSDQAAGTRALPLNTISIVLELQGAQRHATDGSTLTFRLPDSVANDDWINWFANAGHSVLTLIHGRMKQKSAASSLSLHVRIHSLIDRDSETEPDAAAPSDFACRIDAHVTADAVSITPDSCPFLNRGLAHPPRNNTSGATVLRADDGTELAVSIAAQVEATPLTGRKAQSAILQSRWDQACEGMGQVVLVIGDEGTGKSRLIHELTSSVSTAATGPEPVIWRCRPPQRGRAFHPMLEWLQHQLQTSTDDSSEQQREDLATVLRQCSINGPDAQSLFSVELGIAATDDDQAPLPESQRRERIVSILLSWLSEVAGRTPLLFVVEDLQWIDAATLGFLERLVGPGPNNRLLTVLSCRSEFESPWGSRAHQTQVALNRLTTRHIEALIKATCGLEVTAADVATIKMQTGGIPLFIEHHARYRLAK